MKTAGMSSSSSTPPGPWHGWPQIPPLPLPAVRRRNWWEAAIIQGAQADHEPLQNSRGYGFICTARFL